MHHLDRLVSKNLVEGLPTLKYEKNRICEACQKGKKTKNVFKFKNFVSTTRPLEMLHMDLFLPSRTMSLGGNYYGLVIIDYFSRFTWTLFIVSKDHAFTTFKHPARVLENENNCHIYSIKSNHRDEFENERFESFCNKHGIKHNFSASRTPQQNGVVERKIRSLEELARTLLNDSNLPKYFLADVVNTACYVLNRVLIRPISKKTPYELYKGRKPTISHFKVFGCKCFVLNNGKDNIRKFDAKADDGIFIGYSSHSHAYRIYNKPIMSVEEFVLMVFDETNLDLQDGNKNSAEEEENNSELLQNNSRLI